MEARAVEATAVGREGGATVTGSAEAARAVEKVMAVGTTATEAQEVAGKAEVALEAEATEMGVKAAVALGAAKAAGAG